MKKQFCEICKSFEYLQTHHIQSKCYNGSNLPSNLCSLCPNCHNSVHKGDIILEGRFLTMSGNTLIFRKNGDPSITGLEDPKVWRN